MVRRLRARIDRYVRSRLLEAAEKAVAQTMAPSETLHGTYVGHGRMLVGTTWGGRLLVPSDDLALMPDLVAHGIYDVPFTRFVQQQIEPGDVVFDVGANIGVFTVLLAYRVGESGRVVAYEPNPRTLEVLRDNVSFNWLGDRVEIVPKAAGASNASAAFLAPRRFSGSASLQPIGDLLVSDDRRDTVDVLEVETVSLDSRAGHFEGIALIKVDVEGGEEKVFAGMEQLLAAGVVERICFELSRALLGSDWEAFSRRLRGYAADGWTFALLPDSGLPEPTPLSVVLERPVISQVLMTRARR
jgi:FkbM family methyltransferase